MVLSECTDNDIQNLQRKYLFYQVERFFFSKFIKDCFSLVTLCFSFVLGQSSTTSPQYLVIITMVSKV